MRSSNVEKKTKLFLFTETFPYSYGETFLENELKVLSEKFEKIYIFPLNSSGAARSMPSNVELVDWAVNYSYNGLITLFKNLLLFSTIFFIEFNHSSKKLNFIKNALYLKSVLLQSIAKASQVKKIIEEKGTVDAFFYTFWFNDWAIILSVLKKKRIIVSFSSRVHRFDLYDELNINGAIPFRYFQIYSVKEVFCISRDGMNYLTKKFPAFRNKIKLSYLGVFNNGTNPFDAHGTFTLVSCSNLTPVKRVHLIIEALQFIRSDIKWIHLGDGKLKSELFEETKKLPANISIHFKGHISNKEIIEFYKTTPVHLFITTSESEGLPVSIQEAISFGIPVIATDVGGTSEIVTPETGYLINKEYPVKQIAQLIEEFKSSGKNTPEYRMRVKMFWEHNFEAGRNYSKFYNDIVDVS